MTTIRLFPRAKTTLRRFIRHNALVEFNDWVATRGGFLPSSLDGAWKSAAATTYEAAVGIYSGHFDSDFAQARALKVARRVEYIVPPRLPRLSPAQRAYLVADDALFAATVKQHRARSFHLYLPHHSYSLMLRTYLMASMNYGPTRTRESIATLHKRIDEIRNDPKRDPWAVPMREWLIRVLRCLLRGGKDIARVTRGGFIGLKPVNRMES